MIDNSYYDSILENLKYRLVQDDKNMWCLETTHYSGHYSDWKPIQYLNDDEIESLGEEVLEDVESDNDFEEEEFEDIWEDLYEIFEEVFYALVDENLEK